MKRESSRVLSFDLDGTLVQHDFSTAVWREAIPDLVARQRGLPIEDAKRWVYEQYDEVGEGSLAWYDLNYWYERFHLEEDWSETLRRHRHRIRLFPEAEAALDALGTSYRMIILSNATHPFIREEMTVGGLAGRFERVISATSDWGQVKKTESFYRDVCRNLQVEPHCLVHVGDHWEFDCVAPRRAGIEAYFLDRSGRGRGPGVVPDLTAFARQLLDGAFVARTP
jgi:putative hydrolase of the HAD superfamily